MNETGAKYWNPVFKFIPFSVISFYGRDDIKWKLYRVFGVLILMVHMS